MTIPTSPAASACSPQPWSPPSRSPPPTRRHVADRRSTQHRSARTVDAEAHHRARPRSIRRLQRLERRRDQADPRRLPGQRVLEPAARARLRRGVPPRLPGHHHRSRRTGRPLVRRRGHHQRRHRQPERPLPCLRRGVRAGRGRERGSGQRAGRWPHRGDRPSRHPTVPGGVGGDPDAYIDPAHFRRLFAQDLPRGRPPSWRRPSDPAPWPRC